MRMRRHCAHLGIQPRNTIRNKGFDGPMKLKMVGGLQNALSPSSPLRLWLRSPRDPISRAAAAGLDPAPLSLRLMLYLVSATARVEASPLVPPFSGGVHIPRLGPPPSRAPACSSALSAKSHETVSDIM